MNLPSHLNEHQPAYGELPTDVGIKRLLDLIHDFFGKRFFIGHRRQFRIAFA